MLSVARDNLPTTHSLFQNLSEHFSAILKNVLHSILSGQLSNLLGGLFVSRLISLASRMQRVYIYIEEEDANAPSSPDGGHEHVGCVKNMYNKQTQLV